MAEREMERGGQAWGDSGKEPGLCSLSTNVASWRDGCCSVDWEGLHFRPLEWTAIARQGGGTLAVLLGKASPGYTLSCILYWG